MEEYFDVEKKFEGTSVPRPEWWGGWKVIPKNIEFWYNFVMILRGGGQYRMHNRLLFTKNNEKWTS